LLKETKVVPNTKDSLFTSGSFTLNVVFICRKIIIKVKSTFTAFSLVSHT